MALLFFIYAIHAMAYGEWIVDDAAITGTYARNLAEGWGLTSQPGRPPLEAYSNPLWVFILAGFHIVGIKGLYLAPKLAGALLVFATYAVLARGLRIHHQAKPPLVFVVLILFSINAPLVCWLNGGLENPLMAFLVIAHIIWILRLQQRTHAKGLLLAGLIASGLVMTRPDGLIFSILVPIGLVFRKGEFQSKVDSMALWGVGWLVPMSAYLLLRKFYFEAPWPTPFIAKESLVISWLFDFEKWHNLFRSLAGPLGLGILGACLISIVSLWKAGHWKKELNIWLIHWSAAIAVFLLLPYDHLGWYRYATPFLISSYPLLVLVGNQLLKSNIRPWLKPGVQIGGIFLLLGSLAMGGAITYKRYHHPPLSVEEVAERYVYPLDRLAREIDLNPYSIFVPDAGATLWYNKATVYDCLGLLDTTLAFTFMKQPERYNQYVFESIRPDIIGLHGAWLTETEVRDQVSLMKDYWLVDSAFQVTGYEPRVWLWVRKESAPDKQQLLSAWRKAISTQFNE